MALILIPAKFLPSPANPYLSGHTRPQQPFMNNLRTCLSFFSALEDGNVEQMISLCEQTAVVDFEPLGSYFNGSIEGIGKIVWSAFTESFPRLKIQLKDITWVKEGKEAHCVVNIKGIQLFPFIDITDKGKILDLDHIFCLDFNEASQIQQVTVKWDHIEFKKQLTWEKARF